MLTDAAACAFFRNDRIDAFLKYNCLPLERTSFKAAPADDEPLPCMAIFSFEFGLPDLHFVYLDVLECAGRADLTTMHAQVAGRDFGVDLRGAGKE